MEEAYNGRFTTSLIYHLYCQGLLSEMKENGEPMISSPNTTTQLYLYELIGRDISTLIDKNMINFIQLGNAELSKMFNKALADLCNLSIPFRKRKEDFELFVNSIYLKENFNKWSSLDPLHYPYQEKDFQKHILSLVTNKDYAVFNAEEPFVTAYDPYKEPIVDRVDQLLYSKKELWKGEPIFIFLIYKRISPFIKNIEAKTNKQLEKGILQIFFYHYLKILFDRFPNMKLENIIFLSVAFHSLDQGKSWQSSIEGAHLTRTQSNSLIIAIDKYEKLMGILYENLIKDKIKKTHKIY